MPTRPRNLSTRDETRTMRVNLRTTKKEIKFTTIMAAEVAVDTAEAQDSKLFYVNLAAQVSQEAEKLFGEVRSDIS